MALSSPAWAVDDADDAALRMADQATAPAAQASNLRSFVEAALGRSTPRTGDSSTIRRVSLDLQYDNSFAPGWRAVVADRLDLNWPPQSGTEHAINTLKEAYLSWQPSASQVLDVGRINARHGVASGFNPTDFFKTSALRSVVSVDPVSLMENRQGSVMLRGQMLSASGSATAIYSPKLSDTPNAAALNLNWGATNNRDRWLLSLSPKWSETLTSQMLAFKAAGDAPRWGVNASGLVTDSLIATFEWSGARQPSLLNQALRQAGAPVPDNAAWRHKWSAGLTYTTSNKLSITGELEYNGAALDQAQWSALRSGPLPTFATYERWIQAQREPATRRFAFVNVRWQDAMVNHLDLSAMESYNVDDASRMVWLEARYHLEHIEFAAQWQRNRGSPLSDHGVMPQRQSVMMLMRYFF